MLSQKYVVDLIRMSGANPDYENDEIIDSIVSYNQPDYSFQFMPNEVGIWDIYTVLFNDNDFDDEVSIGDTYISSSSLYTFIVQDYFSIILEDETWGFELEDSTEDYDTIITEDGIEYTV